MLVDDHPLVREGLRLLIDDQADLKVCCEAGSVREALDLVRGCRPDGVILDLSLSDGDGMELIRRLSAHYPEMRILVCSMRDESLFAERALHLGAHGYIGKHANSARVLEALRQVLAGNLYVSPDLLSFVIGGGSRPEKTGSSIDRLTDREVEIFSLLGRGLSASRIAKQLHLSVKTVETHRDNIKRKLGLGSTAELMRAAIQWDLQQG